MKQGEKIKQAILFLMLVAPGQMVYGKGNDDPGNNVWGQLEALQAQVDALQAGSPPANAVVNMDCDAGDTLADALGTPGASLEINYSGTCSEEIAINRRNVTLNGSTASLISGAVEVGFGANVKLNDVSIANSSQNGLSVAAGADVQALSLSVSNAGTSGIIVWGGSLVCTDCSSSNNNNEGLLVLAGGHAILGGDSEFKNNGTEGVEVGDSSSVVGLSDPQDIGASSPYEVEVSGNTIGILSFGGSNVRFTDDATIKVEQNVNGMIAATGGTFHLIGDYLVNNNSSLGIGVLGGVAYVGGPIEVSGNGVGLLADDNASIRGTPNTITVTGNTSWGVIVVASFLGDATLDVSGNAGDNSMLILNGGIVDPVPASQLTGNVVCDGTEILQAPFACGFN